MIQQHVYEVSIQDAATPTYWGIGPTGWMPAQRGGWRDWLVAKNCIDAEDGHIHSFCDAAYLKFHLSCNVTTALFKTIHLSGGERLLQFTRFCGDIFQEWWIISQLHLCYISSRFCLSKIIKVHSFSVGDTEVIFRKRCNKETLLLQPTNRK